ncbi:MAG: efflux RND transporter periplasmic adaptor subunit [Armatimonadetes bacterium]|nr:efflux RND transporter periplasmic adaptor subunit [Armatimonadota bacterium]
MNNKYFIRLNIILIILTVLLVGCTAKQNKNVQHNHSEVDYYTCSMHPAVVQEEPGECPICGMDLVLKEVSDEMKPKQETYDSDNKTIRIDPVVVQNMGVRVNHVQYRDISHNVRTIGKVELADDKSYSVNLRFSGWIENIFADKVGQKVMKGDKLFEIYSPELISAQEEYLLVVNTYGEESDLAKAAQRRLILWNIPQSHLDEIIEHNSAQQNVIIKTPQTGYVLHKTIQQGSTVKAGKDLYHIGNLDKIWILADIYEFDISFVKEGQDVKIELTHQPGKIWKGNISFIYPTLNPKTRTQKIRIELNNKELNLKPGMFANVEIEVEKMKNVLTTPTEAIINSGTRKVVFISKGDGRYESREIQTGLADDSEFYTQVISGLEDGEIVVVSGQFLLDSESQLQEAVQKLLDERLQKNIGSDELEVHEYSPEQTTYYTCPMHPNIVEENPGDCPICSMDLIEKEK